jgi:hypothetical protein
VHANGGPAKKLGIYDIYLCGTDPVSRVFHLVGSKGLEGPVLTERTILDKEGTKEYPKWMPIYKILVLYHAWRRFRQYPDQRRTIAREYGRFLPYYMQDDVQKYLRR